MTSLLCGKRPLLANLKHLISQKRFGYIVLVPEIGEDLPSKNALLNADGLPEFNNITIEKCIGAVGQQAVEVEKNVKLLEEALVKTDASERNVFRDMFDVIEQLSCPLETTWGIAKTVYLGNSTLMPTKSYMTIHDRARRARGSKFNSPIIYEVAKESLNNSSLLEEQYRLLAKYTLEGKLNGLELNAPDKHLLGDTIDKLSQERAKFRGKMETATKQFTHSIRDYQLVRDFPSSLMQHLVTDSTQLTKGPWKVTLEPTVLAGFLEHCPDRTQRWNVWQANVRKASGLSDKSIDNSTHIEEIRFLRAKQAKLLGFDNFATMSMETKMAGSLANVHAMLADLREHAFEAQRREIESLQTFAADNGFAQSLEACDIAYWRRKQLKTVYHLDEEAIREYFPLPRVLRGLFAVSEHLFDVRFVERPNADLWHRDVKFYDVFEGEDSDEPIAGLYVDLYCREAEKPRTLENTGAMVSIRTRSGVTGTRPLAALIYNFSAPQAAGKPSLLSFREVQTFFGRFGQALQHLLTRAHYSDVSGVSNIEWDAVNVCGNVMAQMLYDPQVLGTISGHYITEDALPEAQLNSIRTFATHCAGLDLSHELYTSALDLKLYTDKSFWIEVMKEVWPQYMVLPLDKHDSHPCSLAPIFSGDWAAAYFSRVWSRMVAADVHSAFEEDGDTKAVGKRFRDTFLALGGACSPAEVFRRFRGRDPSPKALLRSLGLRKPKAKSTGDGDKV